MAVNILQITTSSMGYVLFMITHRAHACERAVKTSLDGFSSNLLGTYYRWPQVKWATHLSSRTAVTRASARVWVRAWLTVRLFMDGFSSNLGWTYYTSQQLARDTYVSCSRIARTRVSARVRARAWFNSQLSLDGFFSNVMCTYYKWPQGTWDTYL
jgi:hypothetical protein